MLSFDWLIHSSYFRKLPQDSVFVPVFCCWEINLKTKIRKKNTNRLRRYYILSTVIWLFFSQLSKRDSVRSALAAVVLLQLKFSRPFTNVISFKALYGSQPWVFHFLSNVIIQAKFHFAIFQVLLFPISLHWIWNSLRNNSVLFNLQFVRTIITLISLDNFKYPTKIRLCSQPNQNHLLRDFISFSACWDKWKQIARRHLLCYFS